MGEIRIKRDNSDWDNRPAHQVTNGQWVDIPAHHYTNGRWQGELTSQSPLKFRADGDMLDWRVDGRTSENLLDFNALENAPMGTLGTVSTCPHVLELQLKPSTTYTMASNGTGNETAMPSSSYRSVYFADSASPNAVFVNHPVTVTTDLSGVIKVGFFSDRTNAQQYLNGTAHLWLIEGSAALPYEPYGGVGEWDETTQRYKIPVTVNGITTNLYTDHQLMDSDSIDFTTDQTTIPLATGNNTLSVDTAVQPSKVFVKFEG